MFFNKRLLIGIIFFLLCVSLLAADTIPGGNVSGTWYAANSPYYITGDIGIPAGDTLTIEPGVEVKFLDLYMVYVFGFLEAVGNGSDSIHFSPNTSSGIWMGLQFDNAPDNSHLDYCTISRIGFLGSIRCTNSDPAISHCRITGIATPTYANIVVEGNSNPSISDCVITTGYHGIHWNSSASNPTISGCTLSNFTRSAVWKQSGHLTMTDCTISDNISNTYPGAGIRSTAGNLTLINCTISDNRANANHGGGVACDGGTATFTNCTINGNYAVNQATPHNAGGGISFYNASGTLSYCTIFDNEGNTGYGGGIAITNGNVAIDHCTIDGNNDYFDNTGSISIQSGTVDITNSIISNNFNAYGIYNQGTLTVEYTDFFNNTLGPITGNIPAGFGVLDTINYNGDSCDCYYNIFMDPMYVDTTLPDYHLQATSPCIDAGDPLFAYDPDSTVTDMGAYYYHQTGIEEDSPRKPAPVKLTCSPVPFRTEIKISLVGEPGNRSNGEPEIKIYDITGRLVRKLSLEECNLSLGAQATWDAKGVAPGIYFISAGGAAKQKVVKIR